MILKRLLALLPLTLGAALVHTEVTAVTPARGATVPAPQQVTLTLSEPVSLRFSTFKVYPLTASGNAAAVQQAAATLAKTALDARNDAAARADTIQTRTGMAARVVLPLKAGLKPGLYAVLWRLASEDGHPISGQSVFRVK
ncbi:putative copper resistance protein CopC90 [Deinococcus aerius]|uniref:Copper resistance protein CopC n=2 Tax=Deinococcus TaxID=1298 RepID=A0AAJ5F573_9DEIO|nr:MULTISPECIES: copper resistance CopC family protein [Deinococcus]MBB5293885.1 hypothetical protein [Deinococcus metallilatus]QBY07169.1 copper resistance protein CopC [Deinococcus metallilatus]RXJ14641.1 copper resistance protein CopC [Deinococcus metallilatus]TLK30761.1 copper resistance protein CopC [Deinococcus metallilatus]GBF04654.1 putative copper resistance protein CopC90 [Deinococcus aerius]